MNRFDLPEYGDLEYRGSEEIEGEFKFISLAAAARVAAEVIFQEAALSTKCESPIETQLGARLKIELPECFTLVPQYCFDRYRMDFAVLLDKRIVLFIECDGKEFHSTLEQQQNDRAKDTAAARASIPLLRFSGSNIFRYPKECSRQVVALVEGLA